MADPHVLSGLVAKRAEIAGRIEHMQDQLRQLVIDLDHIDASIHIFDPSGQDAPAAAPEPRLLRPRAWPAFSAPWSTAPLLGLLGRFAGL